MCAPSPSPRACSSSRHAPWRPAVITWARQSMPFASSVWPCPLDSPNGKIGLALVIPASGLGIPKSLPDDVIRGSALKGSIKVIEFIFFASHFDLLSSRRGRHFNREPRRVVLGLVGGEPRVRALMHNLRPP